jgi:hypothetical protein
MIFVRSNFFLHTLLSAAKWGSSHLSVVHVTHKFTEVTNGNFLVRVSAPTNGEMELPKKRGYTPFDKKRIDVCIPIESAKSLVAAIDSTKNSRIPTEGLAWIGRNTDKNSVEFLTQSGEQFMAVSAQVGDTKFPNAEKLVRDKKLRRKPKAQVSFDPRMMQKLCTYLEKVGVTCVKLEVRGEDQAMVLKAAAGSESVLILAMPMKTAEEMNRKDFKGVVEADPVDEKPEEPEEKPEETA